MNTDYSKEFKSFVGKKLELEDINLLETKLNEKTIFYYFDIIPQLLESQTNAKFEIKTEADKLILHFLSIISPNSIGMLLPYIFECSSISKNWKMRVKSIELLGILVDLFPMQICVYLPDIIPELTPHINEIKKEIKSAAYNAMVSCCNVVGNSDIEHMTQHIVMAIMEPTKVPELMHELAGVVFVQSVKSSALAMVVPLLLRGLNAKLIATRRQSAIIIENMSKLVDDPIEATPFLPRLLPALRFASETMSDPEARSVLERAESQLVRLEKLSNGMTYKLDWDKIITEIKLNLTGSNTNVDTQIINYVGNTCIGLTLMRDFECDSWKIITKIMI